VEADGLIPTPVIEHSAIKGLFKAERGEGRKSGIIGNKDEGELSTDNCRTLTPVVSFRARKFPSRSSRKKRKESRGKEAIARTRALRYERTMEEQLPGSGRPPDGDCS